MMQKRLPFQHLSSRSRGFLLPRREKGSSKLVHAPVRGSIPRTDVSAQAAQQQSSVMATAGATKLSLAQQQQLEAAVQEILRAASAAEPSFDERRRVEHVKVAAQIERLTVLGKELGVDRVDPDINLGTFNVLLTTDLRAIETDAITTLGRATFNKFGPADLKICLSDITPGSTTGAVTQVKGPFENLDNGYIVYAPVTIVDERVAPPTDPSDTRPLLGFTTAIAEFVSPGSQDPPNRMGVVFRGTRISPAHPETQLKRWLQTLKPHNPNMDEATGVAEVSFGDKAPVGYLDYIVMTHKYQVSVGNFGSLVITQRRE